MASKRPPKKSETIEIRLSHEAKTAFVERCQRDQRTASEAIRLFIDGHISQRSSRRPPWRLIAAALAGAAFGMGAAAPSFASATETTQAAFDHLDRDHDGVLTYREFGSR